MKNYKCYEALEVAKRKISDLEAENHNKKLQIQELMRRCLQLSQGSMLLAKLSATGPAFTNPLHQQAAEEFRNRVLGSVGLNPDGTVIKEPVENV